MVENTEVASVDPWESRTRTWCLSTFGGAVPKPERRGEPGRERDSGVERGPGGAARWRGR